ncbi:metallopeptidase [Rhodococcus coprophilus]|uniref:Lipoprotein n=1 Tax=Rhodococcus coprophilus TaxID=38310 RepID=A0A2X4WZL0_9NOCA|nr:metallopeptidase [Rhodococcus coprophilus]MBM7457372.1 putative metalloprotease [Rhodococcus coprophilus]SQI29614.1 lipoprotein [Rhodococcus coprophilus]
MRRTRRFERVAVPVMAVVLLAGCAQQVGGTAVSIYDNPFTVAGLPVTNGYSGPRVGVLDADVVVENTDGGPVDVLAGNAIGDIEDYWREEFRSIAKGSFEPVSTIMSWDPSERRGPRFCGEPTFDFVNAAYCSPGDVIGWDRSYLMPQLIDDFGPMAAVMVLAHEYGHAIQYSAGLIADDDPGIVFEQQADCFAGAFMRHVAEGRAAHFELDTSDGLNNVLASMLLFRDTDPNDPDSIHGSAFERVTAVQIGFTDGAGACAQIDAAEIETRRADLPQYFDGSDDGELAVTAESVDLIFHSFDRVFELANPPRLDLSGADLDCADAAATSPVSYCPATNTVGVDLEELAERGTPTTAGNDEFDADVRGDYNAYVLVASRYALAVQHSNGQSLTDPRTALRAACLSGVISAALSPMSALAAELEPDAEMVWLSPGDLDEAVSGLLTDGLAASDVNGTTVPSGFSRVDAFRTGVLGGEAACNGRYR